MAELEIHHESEHAIDPMGQRVGVLAALLAVVLAIVSIASHRTHTEAIMQKSSANDAWAHYQSTRVKFHNLELGESLVGASAPRAMPPKSWSPSTPRKRKTMKRAARRSRKKRSWTTVRPKPPNTAPCATTWAKGCSKSPWS